MKKESPAVFFDRKYVVYAFLVLVPFLLYAKSLWYGFSPMDEQWLIVKNTAYLEKWQSVPMSFLFPTGNIYYRPLFNILLIINYHIGGANPFIYHLSGLLLHIACVLLLYRFLLNCNAEKRLAFCLSLLFAIHPVLLHAVVWIPGSNDLVLCAMTLSSLLFLQHYISEKKKGYLALHLLFFAATLATKENAIVLPFVFTIMYILQQPAYKKKELALLMAWWFIIGILWLVMRNEVVNTPMPKGNGLLQTMKQFIMGMLIFTGKTIFPVQQSVFPTLKNSSVIPGIVTTALLTLAYFKLGVRNKSLALTGLALYLALLVLPVWFGASNTSGEHYEHRIYTPLVGLLLFVSQLNIKPGKTVTAIMAGIAILFAVKTFVRMEIYKDEFSFADLAIEEAPDYYLFHMQKADLLFKKQRYEEAIGCYTKAIALRPNYSNLYNNRGHIYAGLKKYKEAIADFSSSINITADNEDAYLNRCIAYANSNDLDHAVEDLVILKKQYPNSIPPGVDRNIIKRWALAHLEDMTAQISNDPENAGLYAERARLYFGSGQKDKALADQQKACSLDPGNEQYKADLEKLKRK